MDHHHQHHNHHQSWRPHAIQGNICPTCNISHFPFCPPHPHPHPSVYSAPNLDPNSMIQTNFNNPGDPYYDPSYSNRNPSLSNFGNVNRGQYGMQNPGYGDVVGYMGNDCRSNNNFDDRSSKRLRVDGNYHGLYGGEGDGGFTPLSNYPGVEGERRLNLVHDHGVPNSGFGYGGDRRGYGLDNSGFERGVDGLDRGIPNDFGVRRAGNVEMSNPAGVGPGMHYQRDGLEQQMGYGSPYGARRGGSDVGNKFQYHDQPVAQYGQVAKPPDPRSFHQGGIGHDNDRHSHAYHHPNSGISHGLNENFHGNYMESLQSNNGPLHYDQRSNMPTLNHYPSSHPPLPSRVQQPGQLRYDYGSPHHFSDARKPIETRPPPSPIDGHMVPPAGNHAVPPRPHYGPPPMDYQGGYGNMGHLHAPQGLDLQPPLPTSPPPPLPMEPPVCWPADHKPLPSPPRVSSSLFPVHVDSSAPVHSSHAPILESHARATSHQLNSQFRDMSHDLFQGDPQGTLTSYGQYVGDGSALRLKKNYSDKPKTTDAAHLFKPPHRSSRPDHFVIILRGLPGSGKSYLAKMLRDLEVEQGGIAPRIHSMDDYFMTEVEKVEENDTSKSSSRFKKTSVKKVLEYCYEPEMEEAYRSSMLKAFKKTLEEGAFTFIIVDDRNLRVADFAQFWATAKRSGYEVYVLEAPYKDPAGCTARNIHGFTQVDVEKMAAQWEEAPPMYLQVDVKSLFHGDDLKESNIEEVDMDTEDGDVDGGLLNLDERGAKTIINSSVGYLGPFVSQKAEKNWDAEAGHSGEEVKDLGRSKWSDNLDVEEDARTERMKGKPNVLSGLNKKYGREGKSVYWGDQGGHTGFSIGAVKKANISSLVIGPGAGYNLKTNPLPEEDLTSEKSGETKKLKKFQEKLRAEQESFKAVFDRRRQRIGGLDADED